MFSINEMGSTAANCCARINAAATAGAPRSLHHLPSKGLRVDSDFPVRCARNGNPESKMIFLKSVCGDASASEALASELLLCSCGCGTRARGIAVAMPLLCRSFALADCELLYSNDLFNSESHFLERRDDPSLMKNSAVVDSTALRSVGVLARQIRYSFAGSEGRGRPVA